ncbi:MAG: DUF1854 domain-containing protein [Pirellulales bacterium]
METTSAAANVELSLDDHGALVVRTADGAEHRDIHAVRCFPLSEPDRWLSLCDPHGREVACVVDPLQLSDPSRLALAEYRRRREFQPIVRAIHNIDHGPNAVRWELTTDRGPTSVEVKSDDDVRRLSGGQIVIIDSHGIRYIVADVASLDAASRHRLERYL